MAKKIQLQDANGNVLHPLTLGECVTMNNGENLDTLMSKSQMFTPAITQNKSMFKVGTGVDVDYSANVKDGAYESLVFKGKSLVNLLTKTIDTTWNLNLENWSIVSTTLSDYVLKPNTTYSVIVYVTEKTCPDRDDLFWVGDVDGKKDKVTHDIVRKNVSLGANVFVINTVPDFSSITSAYRGGINFQGSKFVEGTLKWKAIVLEGDWTNKELPPYFTGLCDSKMPILRTTGKNIVNHLESGMCTWGGGSDYAEEGSIRTGYLRVKPNTPLISKYYIYQFYYDKDKTYLGNSSDLRKTTGTADKSFKVPNDNNIYYARFVFRYEQNGDMTGKTDLQIEEGTVATSYEDHKTNILRTSEEIVLREVGGVQDTYNALTGEYVQRIGEVVLDGSTRYDGITIPSILDNTARYDINIQGVVQGAVMNDRLPNNVFANRLFDEEMVLTYTNQIQVRLAKTKLSNLDVPSFLEYLQHNPIKVQYQLAQPITTIVKPSTMTPFAYQNGHVIVESGHEGQSLLPEIEYSVVTGRTGQVTQNTKVLRKQEQQIIGLEELLLTQVVQMEYERTLLQFDYELQMMMLG